jgi:hypothetical protein
MYTFYSLKSILQYSTSKVLLVRPANIMFNDLWLTALQLKNIHDLSYDRH